MFCGTRTGNELARCSCELGKPRRLWIKRDSAVTKSSANACSRSEEEQVSFPLPQICEPKCCVSRTFMTPPWRKASWSKWKRMITERNKIPLRQADGTRLNHPLQ